MKTEMKNLIVTTAALLLMSSSVFGQKLRWRVNIGATSDTTLVAMTARSSDVLNFQYRMSKAVDKYWQPIPDKASVEMNVVADGLPSAELVRWMLTPDQYCDGAAMLCQDSMMLNVVRFDAALCTELNFSCVYGGSKLWGATRFTLLPREIEVSGITAQVHGNDYRGTSRNDSVMIFAVPIVSDKMELHLGEKSYPIVAFQTNFSRHIEDGVELPSTIYGGVLHIEFNGTADPYLLKLASQSGESIDGRIVLSNSYEMPISFFGASVESLNSSMQSYGQSSARTTLILSPQRITIAGTEFVVPVSADTDEIVFN